jgi:hypothetical protein
MPAAGVYDGPEDNGDPFEVGTVLARSSMVVELYARQPTQNELMHEFHRLAALVRKAIGDDPTLGGEALHTRYLGSDQPILTDLDPAIREGTMELNFVIERREAELNPYASL